MSQQRFFVAWKWARWSGWLAQSSGKRGSRRNRLGIDPLEERSLLSAVITEYSALSSGSNGTPTQLTFASDGNIWFTEPSADEIGVFNPTSDTVSDQIYTTGINADPLGIAATTNNVWFTLSAAGQLGQMTVNPPGSPTLHELQYPPPDPVTYPSAGITTFGSDLWITVPGANNLEVFNPTNNQFTAYSVSPPANIDVSGFSSQIVAASNGDLYFTEPGAIGVFSTSSDTVIDQVSLPSSGGTQMPAGIAVGPDGNIWFTASVSSTAPLMSAQSTRPRSPW